MDFDLRGLLRRVAEEVETEIRQIEELAVARRRGGRRSWRRIDILYEDRWFRVATAVYARLKRQFAEDAEAGEVIEVAKSRLFGLRLEVVEAPLLKIEAAVDREGKIAAVRCRAALDLGVEAVFEGTAPGYRLEKTAQADTSKTAGADAAEDVKRRDGGREEAGVERRGAAGRGVGGGGVERLLEEVRREFSGLPVYVGIEEVYVKRTAPMDKRQFRKYTETCRRLGFRFDRRGERWVKPLEELKIA
jgi:hypothetical protein